MQFIYDLFILLFKSVIFGRDVTQMMLQVDLVRHKAGAWAIWEKRFTQVFKFMVFK